MVSKIFERTIRLIGQNNFDKLQNSNILLVGVGGVGGYVFETLVRCGIGKITVVDFDTFALSNLNRQVLSTMQVIGQNKVDVAKQRAGLISEFCSVTPLNMKVDENTINKIDFSKFDYVIDAIDMVASKLLIIKKAKLNGVRVISCLGTGNKIDVSKIQVCDISKTHTCPLARKMRKMLVDENIKNVDVLFSTEIAKKQQLCMETAKVPVSSVAFVPAAAGILIANTVFKNLID